MVLFISSINSVNNAVSAGTLETPSVYSMSIDELKARAQRFTWADLDNNGFACVENTLMPKNLVQREGVLENSRITSILENEKLAVCSTVECQR
jgi:hypothetical protein